LIAGVEWLRLTPRCSPTSQLQGRSQIRGVPHSS
jgi:hypothetical protein